MAQQQDPWAVVQSKPLSNDDPWAVVQSIKNQAESEAQKTPLGRQAWNAVKTFASDMNPIPMVGQALRFGMNPTGEAQRIGAASLEESIDRAGKAKQEFSEGNIGGGVADALGAIPAVGGMVSSVADPIREGDYGRAAGHVAALALGPKVLRGVGKAAKSGANVAMEGALRINAPLARKYGRFELGKAAVENRILPTKAGAEKAAQIGQRLGAEKEGLLRDASTRVTMNPSAIGAAAAQDVAGTVKNEFASGVRSSQKTPAVIRRFTRRNPTGLAPNALDDLKGVWDKQQDSAQVAKRMGRPITADDKALMSLSKSAREALESVAPGYAEKNKAIRTMSGVRQAAQGRVDIPAGGLDNLAVMYAPGKVTAAARLLRIPAVSGGLALGADAAGSALINGSEAVRAAILANLMASHK